MLQWCQLCAKIYVSFYFDLLFSSLILCTLCIYCHCPVKITCEQSIVKIVDVILVIKMESEEDTDIEIPEPPSASNYLRRNKIICIKTISKSGTRDKSYLLKFNNQSSNSKLPPRLIRNYGPMQTINEEPISKISSANINPHRVKDSNVENNGINKDNEYMEENEHGPICIRTVKRIGSNGRQYVVRLKKSYSSEKRNKSAYLVDKITTTYVKCKNAESETRNDTYLPSKRYEQTPEETYRNEEETASDTSIEESTSYQMDEGIQHHCLCTDKEPYLEGDDKGKENRRTRSEKTGGTKQIKDSQSIEQDPMTIKKKNNSHDKKFDDSYKQGVNGKKNKNHGTRSKRIEDRNVNFKETEVETVHKQMKEKKKSRSKRPYSIEQETMTNKNSTSSDDGNIECRCRENSPVCVRTIRKPGVNGRKDRTQFRGPHPHKTQEFKSKPKSVKTPKTSSQVKDTGRSRVDLTKKSMKPTTGSKKTIDSKTNAVSGKARKPVYSKTDTTTTTSEKTKSYDSFSSSSGDYEDFEFLPVGDNYKVPSFYNNNCCHCQCSQLPPPTETWKSCLKKYVKGVSEQVTDFFGDKVFNGVMFDVGDYLSKKFEEYNKHNIILDLVK